jgi:hypothetical protein
MKQTYQVDSTSVVVNLPDPMIEHLNGQQEKLVDFLTRQANRDWAEGVALDYVLGKITYEDIATAINWWGWNMVGS